MAINAIPGVELSQYLVENCRLWVWDFDYTLLDTSPAYLRHAMDEDKILQLSDAELANDIPYVNYCKERDRIINSFYETLSENRIFIAKCHKEQLNMDCHIKFNEEQFRGIKYLGKTEYEIIKEKITESTTHFIKSYAYILNGKPQKIFCTKLKLSTSTKKCSTVAKVAPSISIYFHT